MVCFAQIKIYKLISNSCQFNQIGLTTSTSANLPQTFLFFETLKRLRFFNFQAAITNTDSIIVKLGTLRLLVRSLYDRKKN